MKAYQGNDPFIFVSYAHDDRDTVFPIIELLQNNGYHVWYDEGLHSGNDWRDELADMIQQCAAFIYMWSKKSAKSGYCKDEIYAADTVLKERMESSEAQADTILPFLSVKLEEAELSSGIRMIINPKQMISGIDVSAKDIVQQIIESQKLEACRDQFRYIEGENWGPARSEYYFDEPADHPVFNSVIDNPIYGDERHFLEIKSVSGMSLQTDDHFITVQPGSTYIARISYCNDGSQYLNASGKVIAQKVKVSVHLPQALEGRKPGILQANIHCSNSEYDRIWDQVALYCPTEAVIEYVTASAKIYNYGKLSGETLGTQLFGEGLYIGFNKFSGILPGGMQYSGSIEFRFTVKPINQVVFRRTVSVDRRNYADRISVLPGDILTFRNYIKNEHYDDITDVTFRDELPKGLTLIPDTTTLYAVPFVQGRKLSDHIVQNGINTGLFGSGVTGVIQYKAQVSKDISDPLELVTKSHLYFTTTCRDEVNRYERVPDRNESMSAEAICYVQPPT